MQDSLCVLRVEIGLPFGSPSWEVLFGGIGIFDFWNWADWCCRKISSSIAAWWVFESKWGPLEGWNPLVTRARNSCPDSNGTPTSKFWDQTLCSQHSSDTYHQEANTEITLHPNKKDSETNKSNWCDNKNNQLELNLGIVSRLLDWLKNAVCHTIFVNSLIRGIIVSAHKGGQNSCKVDIWMKMSGNAFNFRLDNAALCTIMSMHLKTSQWTYTTNHDAVFVQSLPFVSFARPVSLFWIWDIPEMAIVVELPA